MKRKSDKVADILQTLDNVHTHYPELRFGQILANAIEAGNLFYVSDEKLALALDKYLIKLLEANEKINQDRRKE